MDRGHAFGGVSQAWTGLVEWTRRESPIRYRKCAGIHMVHRWRVEWYET